MAGVNIHRLHHRHGHRDASECTIDCDAATTAVSTVTFKNSPTYMVACNITATILEMAAVYLQYGKGGDDEEAPVLPGAVVVVVDVAVQVLLYSSADGAFAAVTAYGEQISACSGAPGHFGKQVHRAKHVGFSAGLAAGLAAIVKDDVLLPFSVWPISTD